MKFAVYLIVVLPVHDGRRTEHIVVLAVILLMAPEIMSNSVAQIMSPRSPLIFSRRIIWFLEVLGAPQRW